MPRRVRAVQGTLQPSSFRWTPPSWVHSPGYHRAGSVSICAFVLIHCAGRSRMETRRWLRSSLLRLGIVAIARNRRSRRPLTSSPVVMDHSCLAMTRSRSMSRERRSVSSKLGARWGNGVRLTRYGNAITVAGNRIAPRESRRQLRTPSFRNTIGPLQHGALDKPTESFSRR